MGDARPTKEQAMQALETLLAWLSPPPAPTLYTSHALPPGVSRRAFNERCRRIPEARRDGKVWIVPIEAYDAAVRRGPQPSTKPKAASAPQIDDAVTLLAGAGVRLRPQAGRR